jgi:hypothetical protein
MAMTAFYKLNDNGTDYIGGRTMTVTAAPSVGAGKCGSSYIFTGDNTKHVQVAHNAAFSPSVMTVMFLTQCSDYTSNYPTPVSKWYDDTSAQRSWEVFRGSASQGWVFDACPAGKNKDCMVGTGSGVTSQTGRWYTICGVTRTNQLYFYVDAKSYTGYTYETYNNTLAQNQCDLTVGAHRTVANAYTSPYFGGVQHLRIYNTALSEQTIKTMHMAYQGIF